MAVCVCWDYKDLYMPVSVTSWSVNVVYICMYVYMSLRVYAFLSAHVPACYK